MTEQEIIKKHYVNFAKKGQAALRKKKGSQYRSWMREISHRRKIMKELNQ